MNLQATITALHDPSFGWYKARTIFGETVSGVNLEGVGTETAPKVFSLGQKVSIWQVNGEFGAFGSGQSYLLVPEGYKTQIIQSAPQKCALFQLAVLAGNTKVAYSTATVVSVSGSSVVVSGSAVGSSKTIKCAIDTDAMQAGHQLLIQHTGRESVALGYWRTVPFEVVKAPTCVVVGRPPFTAMVDIRQMQWQGTLEAIKSNRYGPKFSSSNIAFTSTKPCLEFEFQPYLYTYVIEAINYGAVQARYYIKWHRATFAVTEITQAEYDAQPWLSYSKTDDGKFFWYDGAYCQISETETGTRTNVMFIGGTLGTDQVFPTVGEIYEPLE